MKHFPAYVKPLVSDGEDARRLEGKRVAVIDTVISTGVTIEIGSDPHQNGIGLNPEEPEELSI